MGVTNNKGRCRECEHSNLLPVDPWNSITIRQMCYHYASWCHLVARNCTAFERIKKSDLVVRNVNEENVRREVLEQYEVAHS